MKIYTKTGDDGKSSLADGKRIEKCDIIFDVLGILDELISVIGLVKTSDFDKVFYDFLENIQKILMKLMSGIALNGKSEYDITDDEIKALESEIDRLSENLEFSFVLPGGSELSARLDFARTVARNGERALVKACNEYNISVDYLKYINRLSDYLYTAARYIDSKNTNQ